MHAMTARRAGLSAVLLTVTSVGLMLLMVMFAARSGPHRIVDGPLRDPSFKPVDPSYSFSPPPQRQGGGRDFSLLPRNSVFEVLGWMIRAALLLVLLWLLYRGFLLLRDAVRWRRRPPPKAERVDFDVLDDPDALVEEIRSDAAAQFDLLLGGNPRNAIVACWDRFEEQAERVNASRKPWETSSEFTLRLLEAVSADEVAIARLEALYREARFSDHEMGETRREEAVAALRQVHASLGIGAGAR